MEQLIFFGIIIAFSIAESIARSRKAKAQKEAGEGAEPERFEWAQGPPQEPEVPTYDADPSYDDRARSEERPPELPTGGESAADIWAEIAGLASGTKQRTGGAARPAPSQSPPLPPPAAEPQRSRDRESGGRASDGSTHGVPRRTRAEEASTLKLARAEAARTRAPVRVEEIRLPVRRPVAPLQVPHEVHLAHAGYGTDPSERAPSEQDGLDPLAEHIGMDAAAIQAQLRSKDLHALRQAMILQEVLGPPVSMRE